MMNNIKKVIVSILFGTLIFAAGMPNCCPVYANVLEDDDQMEVYDLQIISYDAENDRSLAVLSINPANAMVYGNGIRLRTAPDESATVLELMYDGEYVWIDWSKYGRGEGGFDWFYIQRIKTGTYGWASSVYVGSLD